MKTKLKEILIKHFTSKGWHKMRCEDICFPAGDRAIDEILELFEKGKPGTEYKFHPVCYEIVETEDYKDMCIQMNGYMRDGWRPQGGVFIKDNRFYQAIIL